MSTVNYLAVRNKVFLQTFSTAQTCRTVFGSQTGWHETIERSQIEFELVDAKTKQRTFEQVDAKTKQRMFEQVDATIV
jgi:hypothetical protein